MKHAAKILAAILVLLTLCSCDPSFWHNDPAPISGDMTNCVKKIFDEVPKGQLFLTAQSVTVNEKFNPVNNMNSRCDLILFNTITKTRVNLTEEIHKINNTAVCYLASDCSKILVKYNETSSNDLSKETKGRIYAVLFDKNGEMILSSQSKNLYFSNDLRYIAYYDEKSGYSNCFDGQVLKKTLTDKITGMEGNYLYFCNTEWNYTSFYNVTTNKTIKFNTNFNVLYFKDANHAIAEREGQFYNLNLLNKKKEKLGTDSSKVLPAKYFSPDGELCAGQYSLSGQNNSNEELSGTLGAHSDKKERNQRILSISIMNLKTDQLQTYPYQDKNEVFWNLNWVEKK